MLQFCSDESLRLKKQNAIYATTTKSRTLST